MVKTIFDGELGSILCVEDRLRAVAACDDAFELAKALKKPHLQSTVRVAIERKIRKLAKKAA